MIIFRDTMNARYAQQASCPMGGKKGRNTTPMLIAVTKNLRSPHSVIESCLIESIRYRIPAKAMAAIGEMTVVRSSPFDTRVIASTIPPVNPMIVVITSGDSPK